ncbi:MAG TPA: hypothetical protein VD994_07130, partial [Prosthecobacter sp.]|nr:hypothetical protein [Prosthecobacter sp.]
KGWDQARLAQELGVSIHTVRSWEQGKNPIPPLAQKHMLQQADIAVPLDLIVDLNQYALDTGMSFEAALSAILKTGLKHSPTKKRGAKPA